MKHTYRWLFVMLFIVGLQLVACSGSPAETATEEDSPVKVEHLDGAEPTRLTLTEDAAKRLDIQTATVQTMQVGGNSGMVIPYAAILYDTEGNTWTYTNPEPLIFVRSPIIVDHIEGDKAYLTAGPPSGSSVVTIGATELFGSESEFEEE